MAELEGIALKPKVFTDVDYFLEMIKEEQDSRNEGWQFRVSKLEEMCDLADKSTMIKNSSDIKDLFPQYKTTLSECSIF